MPGQDAGTSEKLRVLRDPTTYGLGQTAHVELIETHMSWVFLTPRFAYKLKKPRRYPFLDLSTVEARERLLATELRLNRRLADWVYLGLLPLVRDAGGRLGLGGEGRVVDWLLEMRRLPREHMLDRRLLQGRPDRVEIDRVAHHLARFFAASPPARRTAEDHVGILARELALDLATLARPADGIDDRLVERVLNGLLRALARRRGEIAARVAAGHVVDAHGDLRPEHVYLGAPPAIIDCLEFSTELRIRDSADEFAFLALECERLGDVATGEAFLARYEAETGDRPGPALYGFYKALRAAQRARLAVWHAAEPGEHSVDYWLARARHYLELAAVHIVAAED